MDLICSAKVCKSCNWPTKARNTVVLCGESKAGGQLADARDEQRPRDPPEVPPVNPDELAQALAVFNGATLQGRSAPYQSVKYSYQSITSFPFHFHSHFQCTPRLDTNQSIKHPSV